MCAYHHYISRVDAEIGKILESLQGRHDAEDTLIVFTADHGELFGEYGEIGHATLYDPVLLVPLVVAYPGGLEGGSRVRQQVRSIDILPTVLELAGLTPVPGIDGASLGPAMRNESGATAQGQKCSYSWHLLIFIVFVIVP